mgnify:CR=1 FL=1
MIIYSVLIVAILTIWGNISCLAQKQNPSEFVPNGYVIAEKIYGDLNKDSLNDCVLLIKGTDKKNIINVENKGELDRNRRGIIILFNNNDDYELAIKNYNCFSSENEDGGVYFAPELSISIEKGNLFVHYSHGRYGYWMYNFRFKNSDFELIGFDSGYKSNFVSDWVTFDEVSINFLSKKKLVKEVIKLNENGNETFKETWGKINVNSLLKLSKIKDFDELDLPQ